MPECINVNHDRIVVSIHITNGPTNVVNVTEQNCVDLFTQVSPKAIFAGTLIQRSIINMMK